MSAIGSLTIFYGRWKTRPPRRRRNRSLGEVLATSDTSSPTPTQHLTQMRRSRFLDHLLPSDMATDASEHGKARAYMNLYLALGSLGLSSLGVLGVPVVALVALPIQGYFVTRFIQSGIAQVVRKHEIGMAVIDGLVTSALLSMGYFWAISLYASFFIWSRVLVLEGRNRYQDSMLFFTSAPPQHVRVLRQSEEKWIGLDELALDDAIVVYAGEVVPVDGVVLDGLARIDQQFITGEAQPVLREAGESVLAMSLLLSGTLQIRAEQTGNSTVSAQIGTLLRDIRSYTAALTTQAEAVGNRYAVPMLVLSGGTLVLLGPLSALTVLCSYVGYSMRITGPLSVLNYLNLASQREILLKDGRALEALYTVDTVIFDKTGTLTQEQPRVANVYTYADYAEDEVLAMAAAAEHHQTHPIARALLAAADERQLSVITPSDVDYEPGVGVQIKIDGVTLYVVSGRFLEREGIELPLSAESIQAYCHQRGHSLVYVVFGEVVIGAIELAPTLRPEAHHIVEQLQQLGKKVWIVSGDHEQPTRWLAHRLHADAYYANMLPPDKASLIARLQDEGRSICFVGDGINDALALKQANVSVSLHGAAGLALDTAQIILHKTDLLQLLTLFDLAQRLHIRMRGNMICSIVPGVITIAGVYVLQAGIVTAYVLYYTGLTAGIANAMLPLVLSDEQDTQMTHLLA